LYLDKAVSVLCNALNIVNLAQIIFGDSPDSIGEVFLSRVVGRIEKLSSRLKIAVVFTGKRIVKVLDMDDRLARQVNGNLSECKVVVVIVTGKNTLQEHQGRFLDFTGYRLTARKTRPYGCFLN
jgi:hypothetical protein